MLRYGCLFLLAAAFVIPAGNATAEDYFSGAVDRVYDAYEVEVAGFVETLWGFRVQDTELEKDLSLGEGRFQLELNREFEYFSFKFKGDLLADAVTETTAADVRDLSLAFSPVDFMDVKVGRMVSTWGTGDMVFINDMFPKDWQSFFIGRDDEYLKQPANVVKSSVFVGNFGFDFVYTPLFEGSKYVTGERLSYFNPMLGRLAGRDAIFEEEELDTWFDDGEYAARLSRRFGSLELALYGYMGYWQEPEGFEPASGKAVYPRLNVWGGSGRMVLLGGVANIEAGYYDSKDDDNGRNPLVRPSETRLLVGFERELAHEFTGAVQYYVESIVNYDNYKNSLPAGSYSRDEHRHMFTLRLTKMLMDQNLVLSLFTYYSPSDNDGYIRPKITYKLTDNWQINGGGNLFFAEHDYTFWGRFVENSNVYAGVRYSF